MAKSKKPRKEDDVVIKKFLVYLPEPLHRDLRIRSIEEGRSATKLVQSLIDDYLRKPLKKRKR